MKRSYSTAFKKKKFASKFRRVVKRKIIRKRRFRRGLPLAGFPVRVFARLRYVETVTIDVISGGRTTHVVNANSCFDPNSTGTGHQPKGFDQMMANYNHCTVLGSKIVARVMVTGQTQQAPGILLIKLSASGTETAAASGGFEDIMEDSRISGRILGGSIGYNGLGSSNMIVARSKFSAKRFFGKKGILGDSLYRHTDAANPAERAFYEICYSSINSNDPGPVTLVYQVDYICGFTEPKTLPQS